jgi:hypothetical protein
VDLDDLNRCTGALGERLNEPQRGKIQPPGADRIEQLDRSGLVELDVDARMLGAEAPQAVGDVDLKCLAGTDPDLPGEQPRHRTDSCARCRGCGEGPARFGKQRRSRVAQFDLPRGAREEGHAELALERANRCRDRRLRHVEQLRGTREMSLLGNGDEVFELSEIDAASLWGR